VVLGLVLRRHIPLLRSPRKVASLFGTAEAGSRLPIRGQGIQVTGSRRVAKKSDVSLPSAPPAARHGPQFEPKALPLDATDVVEGWPIVSRRLGRAKTIRRTSLKVHGAGKKRTDHARS
jgi:hypothetical protein